MNILLIAKDNIRGGSAKSMNVLHDTLSARGHASRMLLGRSREKLPEVETFPAMSWVSRLTYHGLNLLGLNYVGIQGAGRIAEHPFFQAADVVHYHNLLGGFFNYLALPGLTQKKASVWTLHDMWGLTGHCIHSFDCIRWRVGCGQCPYPRTDPPIRRDATHWEWRFKRRVYQQSRMFVTAPSRWLAGLARESILGVQPVRHVPNAVDTETYRPRDRRAARAELGWPQEATILMFASDTLANPFKHFALLPKALKGLAPQRRSSLLLAMLGEDNWQGDDMEGIKLLRLGYQDADQCKAMFYAAADMFVYPTRADNQPLVVLEAMACGCPVVSMAVGGVPELVRHGETGYLARPGDADDLRHGMETLLADPAGRERMGRAARRLAETEHGVARHSQRMLDVYAEAMDDHAKALTDISRRGT